MGRFFFKFWGLDMRVLHFLALLSAERIAVFAL